MIKTRSYDYNDMILNIQKTADGPAPNYSAHNLNLILEEADVFASGISILALLRFSPSMPLLTHIAIGTDDTPLDPATQTGLIAEVSRWPIDVFSGMDAFAAGTLVTQIYQAFWPKDTCDFNIKEIGIFGDNGSTLYARKLLHYDNRRTGPITLPVDLMIGFMVKFISI